MSWTRASRSGPLGPVLTTGVTIATILAVTLAAPRAARAQSKSNDVAMAETLFEEARKLMANGDYAAACPKLAESNRLDPGAGTLTALALCHEQQGKTATAWAEFIEVATQAQRGHRADREKFARKHIAALEPALARLTITVAPETAHASDVQVHRDDIVVGSAAWGVAVPVDPGDHVVTASAPGKQAWSTHVSVVSGAPTRTVSVPALDDPPAAAPETADAPSMAAPEPSPSPASAAAPAETTGRGSSQRAIGIGVGVGGLVALGLGTYFGIQALSKSHDAKQLCPSSTCSSSQGVQFNDDARTDARVADVAVGVGLVAVGVGAFLLFSAPSDAPPPSTEAFRVVRVVPMLGRSSAGAAIRGSW